MSQVGTDRSATEIAAMADLATPMALRVMATLRIADLVTNGLRQAPELADAAKVDAAALDRILQHLVSVDVLRCDDQDRYTLTEVGQVLHDDHPSGIRAVLDVEGATGRADLSFVQLLHSVRTGEAAFPTQFGQGFWADLSADGERRASYDAQMGRDVAAWAPSIVGAYDWGSLGHVIDVGGGDATLLAALLRAHGNLRGTVFDQPGTGDAALEALRAARVADRCDVVAGDFFDPLPGGADGYLLCAILHDWNDDDAVGILRRCAEAAGSTGKVLVIEKTGTGGETPSTEMDLRMLVYFGGRQRGEREIISLAGRAGLDRAAVHRAGALSIIELQLQG